MTESSQTQNTKNLLEIEDLVVEFPTSGGPVRAVSGVSLDVREGETLGIVGESGSGKTTLGKATIKLQEMTSGKIVFDGRSLFEIKGSALRKLRLRMQIVFQDPNSSLNPRMTIGNIVGDGLKIHGIASGAKADEKVVEALEQVGLRPDDMKKYPHQFSGGQKQRIGIARALILGPDYIVLDEPVSALDVSVQAQVVNLLKDLRDKHHLTYLFIAHDIGVVANISDRVAVMYLGKIMEIGADVLRQPRHPYTKALISAIPDPDAYKRKRLAHEIDEIMGEPPSPSNPPSGCVFRTRCPIAEDRCASEIPILKNGVACHFVE
ncbi:MAG: ABC transporter ATP-binding protein [Candidatus Lindowbacteria bacterium]|nr:ABC transporter ATP-binding protein [Candidatus Lindowbacteria bacterium]